MALRHFFIYNKGEMKTGKDKTAYIIFIFALLAVLIQFIPAERTNPPVTLDVPAPPEVKAVLRRACYDCHSNETKWPWYTNIAPVSWLSAYDVKKGRAKLNFSTWDIYSREKQAHLIKGCMEEACEKEMPPWFHLPVHPEGRLTPEDLSVLKAWAAGLPQHEHDHEDD